MNIERIYRNILATAPGIDESEAWEIARQEYEELAEDSEEP